VSDIYEFRDDYKNVARDRFLQAMESGPVSTKELIDIGRGLGVFPGVTQGMLMTLRDHSVLMSPEWGWWALADNVVVPEVFRSEALGEVETIGPETTRVGEMISHRGRMYRLASECPDEDEDD
jgi:hypothetical protein